MTTNSSKISRLLTTLVLWCGSTILVSCGGGPVDETGAKAKSTAAVPKDLETANSKPAQRLPEPIPGEAFLTLSNEDIVYLSAMSVSFLPKEFHGRFMELQQRYQLVLENLPSREELIHANPAFAEVEELKTRIQVIRYELEQNDQLKIPATPEISEVISRIEKTERELESSETEVEELLQQLVDSKEADLRQLERDYENTRQLYEDLMAQVQRLRDKRQEVEIEYRALLDKESGLKNQALAVLGLGLKDILNNDNLPNISSLSRWVENLGNITDPFETFWIRGDYLQNLYSVIEYQIRAVAYENQNNRGDALYFKYVPADMKRKYTSQILELYNDWIRLRDDIDSYEGPNGKLSSVKENEILELSSWENMHEITSDDLTKQWAIIQKDYQDKRPELIAFLEDPEEQNSRKASILAGYRKKREDTLRELRVELGRLENQAQAEYQQRQVNQIEELEDKRYRLESAVFQKANLNRAKSEFELNKNCYNDFKNLVNDVRISVEITGSQGDFLIPSGTSYVFAEKPWSKSDYFIWLLPVSKSISKQVLSLPNALRLKEDNRFTWVIEFQFEKGSEWVK